jgi:hypothetical protein
MRLLVLLFLYFFCGTVSAHKKNDFAAQDYIQALKRVTDVMLNDVASPVAASRYYAYITLTTHEIQSAYNPKRNPSFAGHLNGFKGIDTQECPIKQSNASLATLLAVLKMGERLLPSGYLLRTQSDSIILEAQKRGIMPAAITASITVVDRVVVQMMAYAKSDGFPQLNTLKRYTPLQGDAWWQPTSPAFMPPVEPNWGKLRTFILDSGQQFVPVRPAAYDTAHQSSFYQQMLEVYAIVNRKDTAEQAIAQYWDCNPFAVQQIGHVQFGLKKISPGGHWIGITGIACLKKGFNLQKTVRAHAMVGLTLADAFIACWDEKYRSNRVRPETAIRKLLDPRWMPLLQTPPFPEYVSGHSVASSAVAVVLTRIFGDNFAFTDDTEVEFDLPRRSFTSFEAAAGEASISRLYGGIHFRDGIEAGVVLGRRVGETGVSRFGAAYLLR